MNRHKFLQILLSAALTFIAGFNAAGETLANINSFSVAKKYSIGRTSPSVGFFEGAVLGNGGLGTIVCTRPDAVVLYFGHNDVWDIRIAEDNKEKIGTFKEIFDKIKSIPDTISDLSHDQWLGEYMKMTAENYRKPYPRPFPCGSAVLWFDRRKAELIGHTLDISNGVCRIEFLKPDGKKLFLEVFTDMNTDRLWTRLVDADGKPAKSIFEYITIIPDPETPAEFPKATPLKDELSGTMSFTQILPFTEVTKEKPYAPHPKDKAFRLTASLGGAFEKKNALNERMYNDTTIPGYDPKMVQLKGFIGQEKDFVLSITLEQGLASSVTGLKSPADSVSGPAFVSKSEASEKIWKEYWSKSGISSSDKELEKIWYRNMYFLRCSLRPGVTCPGLFANWSFRNIGTAWHGDYHMNYNTQQPFWAAFSSNHPELHLPYVEMIEKTLLPVSRKWAHDYYGMRGAFFPHSAYPVEMTMMAYPVPTWGWEVFETPWSVQSLWWHYLYTGDTDFLKTRAFVPVKDAVMFLVDYISRPEAHGKQWGDDLYHFFPSVPPELYGLQPGFDKNYDTIADITLSRFVFKAYLESCKILGYENSEKDLIKQVNDILPKLPGIPKIMSPAGEVFITVKGEDPSTVYNVPASLMTVFPGEEHGLSSSPEDFKTAVNTFKNQQNEGGNDLVFLNVQAARLGMLDLEKFKRQVEYCTLPDGTCADMVLQIHGRYSNSTPYDFMAPMGIWFENFSLPFVINECMLQSYNGELRFFPNWPSDKKAEFSSLRAAGAFLASASIENGEIGKIDIISEKGSPLTIVTPWKTGAKVYVSGAEKVFDTAKFTVQTKPGEVIKIVKK